MNFNIFVYILILINLIIYKDILYYNIKTMKKYQIVLDKWINSYNISIFPSCITDIIIDNVKELLYYDIINKYNNNWIKISNHMYLSEEFIEKFQNKVNWICISCEQELSEEFIEKFKYKVNWYYISQSQELSEEFMEKIKDKVYWYNVS